MISTVKGVLSQKPVKDTQKPRGLSGGDEDLCNWEQPVFSRRWCEFLFGRKFSGAPTVSELFFPRVSDPVQSCPTDAKDNIISPATAHVMAFSPYDSGLSQAPIGRKLALLGGLRLATLKV